MRWKYLPIFRCSPCAATAPASLAAAEICEGAKVSGQVASHTNTFQTSKAEWSSIHQGASNLPCTALGFNWEETLAEVNTFWTMQFTAAWWECQPSNSLKWELRSCVARSSTMRQLHVPQCWCNGGVQHAERRQFMCSSSEILRRIVRHCLV